MAGSIREIFKRHACRTKVYSRSLQDRNNEIKMDSTHQQKSLPRVLITRDESFCESGKNADAKDKWYNSNWNANHTWTEAVGWVNINDNVTWRSEAVQSLSF